MKNGRQKQLFILGLINLFQIENKTIREAYDELKGTFYIIETFVDDNAKLHCKKVFIPITQSCFETSILVLMKENRIHFKKEFVKRSGSKAPIYLISHKQKQEHGEEITTS